MMVMVNGTVSASLEVIYKMGPLSGQRVPRARAAGWWKEAECVIKMEQ
jgi:hypothetical protein